MPHMTYVLLTIYKDLLLSIMTIFTASLETHVDERTFVWEIKTYKLLFKTKCEIFQVELTSSTRWRQPLCFVKMLHAYLKKV